MYTCKHALTSDRYLLQQELFQAFIHMFAFLAVVLCSQVILNGAAVLSTTRAVVQWSAASAAP
jgi:hypothetical protein